MPGGVAAVLLLLAAAVGDAGVDDFLPNSASIGLTFAAIGAGAFPMQIIVIVVCY